MNRPTRGKACILTLLFIIITAASAHGQNTFNTEQDVSNYLVTHDFCSGDTRISFKWETWWGEEGLYMYVIGRIYAGPMHILSYGSERASLAGYNVDQFIDQLVVLPQRSCIYHLDEYYSARPNGKPKIAASSAASKNGSNHNQKTSSEPNKTQKPEHNLPAGAVDMGLSVKWGSCNIGATKPEEYGGCYAWGEITQKHSAESKWDKTKYPHKQLKEEDDVAHVSLGESWRIPTDEEWAELRDVARCAWEWYNYKGVNGYLITSKKTGNSIFLPAAGNGSDCSRVNSWWFGSYWSSTTDTTATGRAWSVIFDGVGVYRSNEICAAGYSVRPIADTDTARYHQITPTYMIQIGAVDMGLSVKWGSCNIGAIKPEESGGYYAWGETATKDDYSKESYNKCEHEADIRLKTEDDVAQITLGENWRIPTDEEWSELRNSPQCVWTKLEYKDFKGFLVTSKKTGNSIFLPAAGYRRGDHLCYIGVYGSYWSSSALSSDTDQAWGIGFYVNTGTVNRSGNDRYLGKTIRPVYDY